MFSYRNSLNFKIGLLSVTVALCLTSTVGYGVEVEEQGYLRVPLITSGNVVLDIEYEGVGDENQQVIRSGLTKELLVDALKVKFGREVFIDADKSIKVAFRRRMDFYTAYELKIWVMERGEVALGLPIAHNPFYTADIETNRNNLVNLSEKGFVFAARPYTKICFGNYRTHSGQVYNIPFFLREYVPGVPAKMLIESLKQAPLEFNAVIKCTIEILVELYDKTGKVIDDKNLNHIVVDLVEDNGKFLAKGKFVEILNVRDIPDKASALLSILEYAPLIRNNPTMVYQAFIDICGRDKGLDALLQFKKFLSVHATNISYKNFAKTLDEFIEASGYRIFEVKSGKDIEVIEEEVSGIAKRNGFDEDSVEEIGLAVVELATNIDKYVENRNGSEIKGYVAVEFISERLEIIVRDFGAGFDVTDENIGVCPDPQAGKRRGRGFFIVIKFMDEGWIHSRDKKLPFSNGEKLPVRDAVSIQGTEVVAIKYLSSKFRIFAEDRVCDHNI